MATEATLATFRTQFPEYPVSVASDDLVERVLVVSKIRHSAQPVATLYLVAHGVYIALEQAAGREVRGEVVQEAIGSMRVQYQAQARSAPGSTGSDDTYFTATSYGRTFLMLEKSSPRFAIGALIAR